MSNNADQSRATATSSSGISRDGSSVRSLSRLRLGAKALVIDGENVLLIRERRADGSTFWTLPGGGTWPTESLPNCLRREIAEELRCPCAVGQPVDMCTYRHLTNPSVMTLYIVFHCNVTGVPLPACSEGVVTARWVSPRNPPRTTLPPFQRVLRQVAPLGRDSPVSRSPSNDGGR